jgi:hypothetical protein
MDDYVTKGFKKLQNQGIIVNNPMRRVSETRSWGTGVLTVRATNTVTSQTMSQEFININSGLEPYVLDLSALYGRSIPDYSRMLAEARTRALANVARPDFAGLVSLGELRESLSYLRNPFKGALKLASAFEWRIGRLYREEKKRPRFSFYPVKDKGKGKLHPDDARIVKELENLYLEFRYGVRPMLQEITSALENIRERAVPRPKRETFRAKQHQDFNDSWEVTTSSGSIEHLESYVYKRNVSVNVGYLYEFDLNSDARTKWGLELGQVPSSLWALAPLSFIVDWGLNVGQFISALTPVPGANRLGQWESVKITHELSRSFRDWHETNPDWQTGQVVIGGKSPDTYTLVEYSRTPHVPLPDLVLKQNFVNTISEIPKMFDLAAIFHQKLRNAFSMGKETSDSITRKVGRPHAASKWYG